MRIDLNTIDTNSFTVKTVNVSGDMCYLVYPNNIGVKWNRDNLIFRSSIWNSDGDLVSAGFPKFSNLGENIEVFGYPKSILNCDIVTKLDGSCLIVSFYKGNLIVRTRGTVDASNLDTGYEIAILKSMYPKIFSVDTWDSDITLLFEWLSPTNRIVIKHDDLDIKLIGAVNHSDYSLKSQSQLNDLAHTLSVGRPMVYSFDTLDNLISEVSNWVSDEGIVLYTNDNKIYKVKANAYLAKHRLKDTLGNFNRVVDFYFSHNMPDYQTFYNLIEDTLDWETAEETRNDISKIIDGMKTVSCIISDIKIFINTILGETRKDAAQKILQLYGKDNRTGIVFKLLDGKELCENELKKLLYQVLKNN